jgi:hypothetical protein
MKKSQLLSSALLLTANPDWPRTPISWCAVIVQNKLLFDVPYSFQKWNEAERFFHFVWLQNPFHNLKRFIRYRNFSPCKRKSATKIRLTLKLPKKHYKFVTKLFHKKSIPFYKRYRFVSDPFDIRYGWICELGNIGTVCTVFNPFSARTRHCRV